MELEQRNIYIDLLEELFRLTIRAMKFSLYLVISFLELLIKIIKVLFNMTEYKPFQSFTEGRNNFLNNIAQQEINRERVKFVTEYNCKHEYIFPRTQEFNECYKEIQTRLKDISEHNIELNRELYIDTIKRINALVVMAEREAMKESYAYAKKTKYKLDETEVYDSYILDKIMQGESNRKFRVEEE